MESPDMRVQYHTRQELKRKSAQESVSVKGSLQLEDNRREGIAQRKLQNITNDYSRAKQMVVISRNNLIGQQPQFSMVQRIKTFQLSKKRVREPKNQNRELSKKQIQEIDNNAWSIAVAATAPHRPEDQIVKKINHGFSEDMDANTIITGADNMECTVNYYGENEDYSTNDASLRLGQMTSLFTHELEYHANVGVVEYFNTADETTPDEEHSGMFDPEKREYHLEASKRAIENLENLQARRAYVTTWEADVLKHIAWDDDLKPKDRKEAKKWAKQAAGELITYAESL
jgi:hypothetical protein